MQYHGVKSEEDNNCFVVGSPSLKWIVDDKAKALVVRSVEMVYQSDWFIEYCKEYPPGEPGTKLTPECAILNLKLVFAELIVAPVFSAAFQVAADSDPSSFLHRYIDMILPPAPKILAAEMNKEKKITIKLLREVGSLKLTFVNSKSIRLFFIFGSLIDPIKIPV